MAAKNVNEYIEGLGGWQTDVTTRIREIISTTAPEAKESIKWAQPVYELNGPFAYMKAFKNSVNFGFWRGIDLDDPQGLLQGTGEKMRHVKLAGLEDINDEAFAAYVQQAVALNLEKGDPTKG